MKSRIITPKVGFKGADGKITERICFPMYEVSAAQESEFWVGLNGLADKPKEEKTALQFDLMVETIAEWAAEIPFVQSEGKENTPIVADATPSAAVQEYFKDRTMRQERMVNAIINAYSNELAANVVF